jgi:hypothetical protein
VKEVLPEVFLGEGIGRFAAIFAQHPHCADIAYLDTLTQAIELKGLDHSLGPVCHDIVPFLKIDFPSHRV